MVEAVGAVILKIRTASALEIPLLEIIRYLRRSMIRWELLYACCNTARKKDTNENDYFSPEPNEKKSIWNKKYRLIIYWAQQMKNNRTDLR